MGGSTQPAVATGWDVRFDGRACRVSVDSRGLHVPDRTGIERPRFWRDLTAVEAASPFSARVTFAGTPALILTFATPEELQGFTTTVDGLRPPSRRSRVARPAGGPAATGPPPPPPPPAPAGSASLLAGMTAGRALNGGSFVLSGVIALVALTGSGGAVWVVLVALAAIGYGAKILLTRTGYWWTPWAYALPVGLVLMVFARPG